MAHVFGDLDLDLLDCLPEPARLPLDHSVLGLNGVHGDVADDSRCQGGSGMPLHFATRHREPQCQTQGVRVAMLTSGSRGDVQPMVALARTLQERGHEVEVFTNPDLVDFCEQAGIKSCGVFAPTRAVMQLLGGMKYLEMDSTEQRPSLRAFAGEQLQHYHGKLTAEAHQKAALWLSEHRGSIATARPALSAFRPDVMLYTYHAASLALAHEHAAGVPAIPVHFNLLSSTCLSPPSPPRPTLIAMSAALDPNFRVQDSEWYSVTGPWVLDEEISPEQFSRHRSLAELRAFVEAGDKPVVVGWGSMIPHGMQGHELLGLALRGLRAAGKRGVIVGGWAELDRLGLELLAGGLSEIGPDHDSLRAFARTSAFFAPHVPHAWLLERSSCIVHHGGSGTTHAAVLAGCPSVVTPICGDQVFFADVVARLRVGRGFARPLRAIAPEDLAAAIAKAEATGNSRARQQLSTEDGVQAAVLALEDFLHCWVQTGRWSDALRSEMAQQRSRF